MRPFWKIILLLARDRGAPVEVFKVKTHVSCRDLQAHDLTACNSEVDLMAKKHARRIFNEQIQDSSATINGAVALQVHMISTLHKRTNLLKRVQGVDQVFCLILSSRLMRTNF